jgi:D-alanyl-D-alanine dipeptidase
VAQCYEVRVIDTVTSEETALSASATRLCARFSTVAPEVVHEVLRATYARFDGRPIRDFVPLLVERAAAERLREVAVPA